MALCPTGATHPRPASEAEMAQQKQTLRPSPTALLNPRYDFSFKAMFTQETRESPAALQDFISTLLGRNVTEITLLPNEPPVETAAGTVDEVQALQNA